MKHADRVLAAVTRGERPYQLDLSSIQVHRALVALEHRGILRRPAPRAAHVLWEPMFGDWIRRKLG